MIRGSVRANYPRRGAPLAAAATLLFLAGCGGGPSTIKPPSIDAGSAGRQAMEQYDTNGDGVVAGDELENAPSLKAALGKLDEDGDGGVSADEVANRIRSWQATRTGLTSLTCYVELDGQGLADAEVVFEPEAFLGGAVQAATGKTNQMGRVSLSIPKENRPRPDAPPGVALGLYLVRISKSENGTEQIPNKYNTDTVLGEEIAYDSPSFINGIRFGLESR